jgi:hypothetical protein
MGYILGNLFTNSSGQTVIPSRTVSSSVPGMAEGEAAKPDEAVAEDADGQQEKHDKGSFFSRFESTKTGTFYAKFNKK